MTNTVENTIQVLANTEFPSINATISLIPNPTADWTQLTVELQERTKVVAQIIDLQGRVLKRLLDNESLPKGETKLTVDTGDLAPGIYFLKVETEKGPRTVKLIKG